MNHMMIRQYKMVKMVPCMRLVSLMFLTILAGGMWGQTEISDVNGLKEMAADGNYIIVADIDAKTFSNSIATFSGTLEAQINPDTNMPYHIKNLSKPLFATLTGTVRNLVIENVTISQSGQVGAVTCVANGTARIYNVGIHGGRVKSTGTSSANNSTDCCGGIVGFLDGEARVINCYNYADITGGNRVGGIVGYNNFKTDKNKLKTMVFGCMFYGEISINDVKSIAPIYNGQEILNKDDNGVSNFNYCRAEASYVQQNKINIYNCALLAETRFLQRFEFFRHLLNGHREVAAWWVSGNVADTAQIMKWVMLPDSIGSAHPYPVLKKWGRYPSVVNLDAEHATTGQPRNQGGKLGELSVTIEMGDGEQFGHPADATITTTNTTLIITDKDTTHFNFNYHKVQLPYYNDVGTKNYTGGRVVVGWKITTITGGTAGTFSVPANDNTPAEAPYYNFADRNCTDKDLYSVSGRIFNQGDYWDVPEGVTAITIQPYWAKAAFVADDYREVVYNTAMSTKKNISTVAGGQWFTNNNDHIFRFNGEDLTLRVYSAISNAVTAMEITTSHTVYDYAVVLVGNYHQYNGILDGSSGKNQPYTIMSIDLDKDNEPDYSYILRFDSRTFLHPVRIDFLSVPGLGMAQKASGGTGSYNFGIPKPRGWFEVTNTALFRVTQFEYSPNDRVKKPIILHGGVIEQWVSSQGANNSSGDPGDRTSYFYMGDNVWFKEFHIGVHQDYKNPTPHPPVSVTGGDYDQFYLTGLYQADATNYNDNAECYINGGRFGIMAGAGMEGIGNASTHTNGNITWLIDHADIHEFYGGGINAAKPVQGNISTTISNSHVGQFCGGPKFGDMEDGRTVTTIAKDCIFGTYFGAGYGGNSYSRYAPSNKSNIQNIDWNDWVRKEYKQNWNGTYQGVSTQINYQFIPMSGNASNVARLWVEYVKFSLAKTHNVTSNLTDCTVTGNFYGGGSLGKVAGNATSTLKGCTVNGNVFGAGFSASLPSVEVDSIGYRLEPLYYTGLGTYRTAVKGPTTTYTWQHRDGTINDDKTAIDKKTQILYTNEDLTTLGTVEGLVTLNIEDGTTVAGDVFGGGESSNATGNVVVNINGGSASNVYGGGSVANVGGSTTVNLTGGRISGDVYGGGKGRLASGTAGEEDYIEPIAATVGDATVELNKNVADDAKGCVVIGNIFGCNNLNGTPLGTATVHVYATQNDNASRITNPVESESDSGDGNSDGDDDEEDEPTEKVKGRYDVNAVYGGGNLAAYVPTDLENGTTRVIIDGCDRTSIKTVYGGGNAASTPATNVTVNNTFEIEELFGGGNGADRLPDGSENSGANVGFKDYSAVENIYNTKELRESDTDFISNYVYGTGKASVTMYGGQVHRVFGGSNTKGNVRQTAVTMLDDANDCEFAVEEAYGGGKSAPMDAEAQLLMSCIPGLNVAYGGAEAADIQGNVTLNISNGTFKQVFGGNNISGIIRGSITVNIEETGCKPIVIGELYGGGNLAAYSVYGYREETETVTDNEGNEKEVKTWVPVRPDDEDAPSTPLYSHPTINVKSFTQIGEVYGGGMGTSAVMVGNPIVNIDQVPGKFAHLIDADDDGTADNNSEQMGTIGIVYGGGNEAEVVGDTNVNIATHDTIDFVTKDEDADSTEAQPRTGVTVKGANITGNVFGGGNHAAVTGNSNVTIGKQATTE